MPSRTGCSKFNLFFLDVCHTVIEHQIMVPSTSLDQDRPLRSSVALGEMKAVKALRKKDKTCCSSPEEEKHETRLGIFLLLLETNALPDSSPIPIPTVRRRAGRNYFLSGGPLKSTITSVLSDLQYRHSLSRLSEQVSLQVKVIVLWRTMSRFKTSSPPMVLNLRGWYSQISHEDNSIF